MPAEIIAAPQFSLRDLVGEHRAGRQVLKTPHVGNQYPNNLAMASLGIPILLCDQTLGERDKNFHPHQVIKRGRRETVASASKMVSHALVTSESTLVPSRFRPGERLSDAHVSAFREAFPSAPIETASEQKRRRLDMLLPALELLTRANPTAWQRRMTTADGTVMRDSAGEWHRIERHGVHGLTPDGTGWIIPNAWVILFDGAIGALETKCNLVYELSGPDMIQYAPKLTELVSAAYDLLRCKLWPQLPETLQLNIVPVAEMRLVTTMRRRAQLDRVVEAYQQLMIVKTESGSKISQVADQAARSVAIEQVRLAREHRFDELRDALRDCPEILYQIERGEYLSQYDLLDGESLYVHPWGLERSSGAMTEMMGLLRRASMIRD